jgi:hypothetical protein
MPAIEASPLPNIFTQAEQELGAFLRAATDLVSLGGFQRASDLWIQAMEDGGCPGTDLAKFFRGVTIRAGARLSQESRTWIPPEAIPCVDLAMAAAE